MVFASFEYKTNITVYFIPIDDIAPRRSIHNQSFKEMKHFTLEDDCECATLTGLRWMCQTELAARSFNFPTGRAGHYQKTSYSRHFT